MAQLTVTMSASIRCLGAEPPDLWNAYNWNAFVWGAGTATVPKIVVRQLTQQSITPSAAKGFNLTRLLNAQSIGSSDLLGRNISVGLPVQAVTATDSMEHEYLQDPAGYYHVFPGQTTDAVNRTSTTWGAVSSTAVTWSTAAAASTVWS